MSKTPNITSALRKAGSTALRDMRREAKKAIREEKMLKAKAAAKALHVERPRSVRPYVNSAWALNVSGGTVRVSDYPHRQTKAGVVARINRGKSTLIKSAFVATMKTGHKGVFRRKGAERLPIVEPVASRPVDALLKPGRAKKVAERGAASFNATFARLGPGAYQLLPSAKAQIK